MSLWCHPSQRSRYGKGGADVRAEGAQLPWKPREHREPAGGLHCRRWGKSLESSLYFNAEGTNVSSVCLFIMYLQTDYVLWLCIVLTCWAQAILISCGKSDIAKSWCSLTCQGFTLQSIIMLHLCRPSTLIIMQHLLECAVKKLFCTNSTQNHHWSFVFPRLFSLFGGVSKSASEVFFSSLFTLPGPILVITEYCCYGDLLNFLRRNREAFKNSQVGDGYYRNVSNPTEHTARCACVCITIVNSIAI